MKKWIIAAGSIFLLFLLSSYFLIPRNAVVTKTISIKANPTAMYRFLNDKSNWQKWWPGLTSNDGRSEKIFEAEGYRFKLTKSLYNSFEIVIEKGTHKEKSLLHILPLSNDSIKIEWDATINTGTNPFSKIIHYFNTREISKTLQVTLTALQKYTSDVKHIYGIDIRKEKVQIEFLISKKQSFNSYPNIGEIYKMIGQLKKYITGLQAKEEDYPMLHISPPDGADFEVQVAIPVDQKLPDTDTFISKRMLKNGNILVAEITGGKDKTDSAMKQIELYVSDYQYSNVALPFQSLVTDRSKVADSSKWVTKIYYPIR